MMPTPPLRRRPLWVPLRRDWNSSEALNLQPVSGQSEVLGIFEDCPEQEDEPCLHQWDSSLTYDLIPDWRLLILCVIIGPLGKQRGCIFHVSSQTQCQCQSVYTLDVHWQCTLFIHCSGPSVAPVQLYIGLFNVQCTVLVYDSVSSVYTGSVRPVYTGDTELGSGILFSFGCFLMLYLFLIEIYDDRPVILSYVFGAHSPSHTIREHLGVIVCQCKWLFCFLKFAKWKVL